MTIDKMKQAFPERDQSKPAEQQGVFRKFEVRRIDGSDAPGGKHYGCRYFVIDMDHDQYAGAALSAYGTACAKTHPELSSDLLTEFPVQAECHVLTDAEIMAIYKRVINDQGKSLFEFARAVEAEILSTAPQVEAKEGGKA